MRNLMVESRFQSGWLFGSPSLLLSFLLETFGNLPSTSLWTFKIRFQLWPAAGLGTSCGAGVWSEPPGLPGLAEEEKL